MANANYDSMFSQKTCMYVYSGSLFIIVKNYEHKCPSIGKWINTLWCNHKECHSAMIRNQLLLNATMQQTLKNNAKYKNLDSKVLLRESIYRTFSRRQNYRDRKKEDPSSCQRLRNKTGEHKEAGPESGGWQNCSGP